MFKKGDQVKVTYSGQKWRIGQIATIIGTDCFHYGVQVYNIQFKGEKRIQRYTEGSLEPHFIDQTLKDLLEVLDDTN